MSGLGRCSLTAVIPILSVMGIQAVPLPTALLSTQTDGFGGFTFRDLTDDLEPYFEHILSSVDGFDAFYSGFLGSYEQIDKILCMAQRLKGKTPFFVDTVMADGGKLYTTYTYEMVGGMRKLASCAQLITPNVTEACFLLEKEYKEEYSKEEIAHLVRGLSKITKGDIVVTGIKGKHSVNSAYSTDGGITVGFSENEAVDCHFPGTGDIFASVLIGCLLKDKSLAYAVKCASGFVKSVMEHSLKFDYPTREGVLLEDKLFELRNF